MTTVKTKKISAMFKLLRCALASKSRIPAQMFQCLPKRLSSSKSYKELKSDYKVDTLDRRILYKFGPKNKYANSAAVPKTVSRAEIENASSASPSPSFC